MVSFPVLTPSASKGAAMNSNTDSTPVFTQQGRKGIAYDWQSLYAAAEVESVDQELAALVPAFTE